MSTSANPFAQILEQLAWRGPNGRSMEHVVLFREEAEALVARLAAPRCRFGCSHPVVGVYWMPEGCACWRDPVQALCAQHASKAEPIGRMILICGPGLP